MTETRGLCTAVVQETWEALTRLGTEAVGDIPGPPPYRGHRLPRRCWPPKSLTSSAGTSSTPS